ncbi:uncharacterized protein LOC125178143 [Hyalella azteca]|uniref:Uncharacterized protein LOC125178143 n=1 Tax=Hyalella azteca TaxID=294128 RepID=A0A979FJP3_HYAAZ|nr:uncharacterized protein LOC125178143 [Hyalella azteca]
MPADIAGLLREYRLQLEKETTRREGALNQFKLLQLNHAQLIQYCKELEKQNFDLLKRNEKCKVAAKYLKFQRDIDQKDVKFHQETMDKMKEVFETQRETQFHAAKHNLDLENNFLELKGNFELALAINEHQQNLQTCSDQRLHSSQVAGPTQTQLQGSTCSQFNSSTADEFSSVQRSDVGNDPILVEVDNAYVGTQTDEIEQEAEHSTVVETSSVEVQTDLLNEKVSSSVEVQTEFVVEQESVLLQTEISTNTSSSQTVVYSTSVNSSQTELYTRVIPTQTCIPTDIISTQTCISTDIISTQTDVSTDIISTQTDVSTDVISTQTETAENNSTFADVGTMVDVDVNDTWTQTDPTEMQQDNTGPRRIPSTSVQLQTDESVTVDSASQIDLFELSWNVDASVQTDVELSRVDSAVESDLESTIGASAHVSVVESAVAIVDNAVEFADCFSQTENATTGTTEAFVQTLNPATNTGKVQTDVTFWEVADISHAATQTGKTDDISRNNSSIHYSSPKGSKSKQVSLDSLGVHEEAVDVLNLSNDSVFMKFSRSPSPIHTSRSEGDENKEGSRSFMASTMLCSPRIVQGTSRNDFSRRGLRGKSTTNGYSNVDNEAPECSQDEVLVTKSNIPSSVQVELGRYPQDIFQNRNDFIPTKTTHTSDSTRVDTALGGGSGRVNSELFQKLNDIETEILGKFHESAALQELSELRLKNYRAEVEELRAEGEEIQSNFNKSISEIKSVLNNSVDVADATRTQLKPVEQTLTQMKLAFNLGIDELKRNAAIQNEICIAHIENVLTTKVKQLKLDDKLHKISEEFRASLTELKQEINKTKSKEKSLSEAINNPNHEREFQKALLPLEESFKYLMETSMNRGEVFNEQLIAQVAGAVECLQKAVDNNDRFNRALKYRVSNTQLQLSESVEENFLILRDQIQKQQEGLLKKLGEVTTGLQKVNNFSNDALEVSALFAELKNLLQTAYSDRHALVSLGQENETLKKELQTLRDQDSSKCANGTQEHTVYHHRTTDETNTSGVEEAPAETTYRKGTTEEPPPHATCVLTTSISANHSGRDIAAENQALSLEVANLKGKLEILTDLMKGKEESRRTSDLIELRIDPSTNSSFEEYKVNSSGKLCVLRRIDDDSKARRSSSSDFCVGSEHLDVKSHFKKNCEENKYNNQEVKDLDRRKKVDNVTEMDIKSQGNVQQLSELESRISTLAPENQELKSSLTQKNATIEDLKLKLECSETNLKELELKTGNMQSRVAYLDELLKEEHQKLVESQFDVERCKEDIFLLQSENKKLVQEARKVRVLQSKLNLMTTEKDRRELEVDELLERVKQLESSVNDGLMGQLHEMRLKVLDSDKLKQEVEREVVHVKFEVEALEQKLRLKDRSLVQERRLFEEMKISLEEKDMLLREEKIRCEKLRSENSSSLRYVEDLKDEVQRLKGLAEEKEISLTEVKTEVSETKNQLRALKRSEETLKDKNKLLEEEKNAFLLELKLLKREKQNAEDELNAKKLLNHEEVLALRTKYDKLEQELMLDLIHKDALEQIKLSFENKWLAEKQQAEAEARRLKDMNQRLQEEHNSSIRQLGKEMTNWREECRKLNTKVIQLEREKNLLKSISTDKPLVSFRAADSRKVGTSKNIVSAGETIHSLKDDEKLFGIQSTFNKMSNSSPKPKLAHHINKISKSDRDETNFTKPCTDIYDSVSDVSPPGHEVPNPISSSRKTTPQKFPNLNATNEPDQQKLSRMSSLRRSSLAPDTDAASIANLRRIVASTSFSSSLPRHLERAAPPAPCRWSNGTSRLDQVLSSVPRSDPKLVGRAYRHSEELQEALHRAYADTRQARDTLGDAEWVSPENYGYTQLNFC